MNLAPFEALLKEAIGLDAGSIGVSAVERAVRQRALVRDAGDRQAYLDRLRTTPAELGELIDAVIVPETWFFRDRGAFAALSRIVREELANPGEPLRVLSFPCATGEEPYSIAMTLIDSGLSRERFRIDAFDVSPRLIARALAAVYGKNSFRGADLAFRSRYFERDLEGYRLVEPIRTAVRFQQGNLVLPASIERLSSYDIVFCRNLLIYFDAPTQERALANLKRLVRADGLLFVGSSESNLVRSHGFEQVKAQLSFAFRKRQPGPSGSAVAISPHSASLHRQRPVRAANVRPSHSAALSRFGPEERAAHPGSATATEPDIAEIERLADGGHLAEAARRCEAHLTASGPSPDALVLLALIRDAAGNAPEAIDLYRKALYLDPNHESALMHLRLRLEQAGDETGARRLDDRMRRIAERRAN